MVGTGVSPGRVVAVGGSAVGEGVGVGCACRKSLNEATCTPLSPRSTANWRAALKETTEQIAVARDQREHADDKQPSGNMTHRTTPSEKQLKVLSLK